MSLFLLDGSVLGATMDVVILFFGAVGLTSLVWYYGVHKKGKDKIGQLKKSLDKVQPQHDILQNQHEHLKSEHAKVKQGLSDLMENYQLLNTKHEQFIANQSSKKNTYEQVDEERQALLDSYESLENNYNALDAKYNDAETTLDQLEDEIENIKDEKEDLLFANKQLRLKISKLTGQSELSDDLLDLEAGSTDEDDEIEKLIGAAQGKQFSFSSNNTNSSAEQSDDESKIELENLKLNYHNLEVQHQEQLKQFEELKNNYDKTIASKHNLKETAESVEGNDFANLQDTHNSLQEDYAALELELNNKILPQLRATQSLLNKKEEKYRQLLSKMNIQTTKFENSSYQLKSYEGVKATSQALYLSNKGLAEKNTELERKYEKLNGEYSVLHSQFQLLRDQFSNVESKLELTKNDIDSSEFAQLSKEYSDLKIKYLAASDQFDAQQNRINELEDLLNSINESSSYGIIYLPSNLQIIEGIGPKIESVLNRAGIKDWSILANIKLADLQDILKDTGKRLGVVHPKSWIEQAQLLTQGKWKAFRNLEASLIAGKKVKDQISDDLKRIEGVGPNIEVLLNNANILTWKKLSKTGIGELKRILKAGGNQYQSHDPSSWPEQAALAASSNWDALDLLKEELKGGRAQA